MSRTQSLLTGLLCLVLAGLAHADPYPSKVIPLVVPFSAGGPTDTVARLIAQPMGKTLGQTVIIENIGGAGWLHHLPASHRPRHQRYAL